MSIIIKTMIHLISKVNCGNRPVTERFVPTSGGRPCRCPTGGSLCFLPSPMSCNKFYHCANNTQFEKVCASGLTFNTFTSKCDWPSTTFCGTRPITVQLDPKLQSSGGNSCFSFVFYDLPFIEFLHQ